MTPLTFSPSISVRTNWANMSMSIAGNVTDEEKRISSGLFAYFVDSKSNSYGAGIGRHLELVEVNVWNKEKSKTAQTVCEITVTKGRSSTAIPWLSNTQFGCLLTRYVQCIRDSTWSMRCVYHRSVSQVHKSEALLSMFSTDALSPR